jgi:hypothetical protein
MKKEKVTECGKAWEGDRIDKKFLRPGVKK